MELRNDDHDEGQMPVSVFQGDGLCISRILSRESSVGQSSRIFYRAAEGIPFRWEMQPGTPKNPQQDEIIPPLSPSPLMQSLGRTLPNVDHDEPALNKSKIRSLKKLVKKSINLGARKKVEILGRIRKQQQETSKFGDSNGQLVGSSLSSDSSSSSSSSFSSNSRLLDSSDGPFCCNPWNITPILDEGNTRIYYCSHHKTAFAVEEYGSFLSRILSRVSAADQVSGPSHTEIASAAIPFQWEMQPGTPKRPQGNELIPPPSPPPVVQSLALPRPRPRLDAGGGKAKDKAWFWTRSGSPRKKESVHEISFRHHGRMEACSSDEEEFDFSSVSCSSSASGQLSKIKRSFRGSFFSCGSWRNIKSFKS